MEESGEPDWYLQAWCKHFGKRQADLSELGYQKWSAFKIWHSRQPYGRKQINEIAAWLGIQPYELLMPPREALILRQLRETAQAIVLSAAEPDVPPFQGPPMNRKR